MVAAHGATEERFVAGISEDSARRSMDEIQRHERIRGEDGGERAVLYPPRASDQGRNRVRLAMDHS